MGEPEAEALHTRIAGYPEAVGKQITHWHTGRKKFTVAKMVKISYNSSMKFEKETKMLAQFSTLSVREQTAMLKSLRAAHAQARADLKAGRALLKADRLAAKEAKAAAKAEKQAASIAKAQARLDKLLAKQAGLVGAKAARANRKPSKATVTTYGAEDNAIAAAIMAKKGKV